MIITSLFTAVLALIFFAHSLRVILARGTTKTNLGDGGNDVMFRRIRIHGNFAEYAPILIIILGLLEYAGANQSLLITYALIVVLGRLLHAYGLWSAETPGWARILGMQLTLWPLLLGALGLLYYLLV